MLMQKGDILDRLSILILKTINGLDADELSELLQEFMTMDESVAFLGLLKSNSEIWKLESDIRKGKKMKLEEVGRRALAIRDKNKERIYFKNLVSDYKEQKINHASE